MKQIEIVITSKLSFDAEELIREYFAVKRANNIEGFLISDIAFIHRHYNTYPYREMRNADFHAVYQVQECYKCLKPYKVNINDRLHLYGYLKSTYKLCLCCKSFDISVGQLSTEKLNSNIAS